MPTTHPTNRTFSVILIWALFFSTGCRAQSNAQGAAPEKHVDVTVGVTNATGKTVMIKSTRPGSSNDRSDAIAIVEAKDLGDGRVELRIQAQESITKLLYPIASKPRAGTYEVFTAFKFGQRIPSSALKEWGWRGLTYPGMLFAPILISECGQTSELLYADDWPPQKVDLLYSRGREAISMPVDLDPGTRTTVRYRQVSVSGDWRKAMDVYRAAVRPFLNQLPYRKEPPSWMIHAHGFRNVQLQNTYRFDIDKLEQKLREYRDILPWVQFWGQMSHHMEVGKAMGEEVGCCLFKQGFHSRYHPDLIDWSRKYVGDRTRVGFYTRPTPGGSCADPNVRQDLLDWQQLFRLSADANASYIDVISADYHGPVLEVGKLLAEMPEFPMIEGADIFLPFGHLISGAYRGKHAFPEFGRYLLNDRLIFLGESNNGWVDWGAKGQYRQEIRCFLLGAKFDAIHPNDVVREISRVRDAANWWGRSPRFEKIIREGSFGESSEAIFVDRDGLTLKAIVSWRGEKPRFTITGILSE